MDEEKDNPRNREGVDTADQPAEGGPYIEDDQNNRMRTDERTPDNRRQTPERTVSQPAETRTVPNTMQNELVALFDKDATERFRSRWLAIQSKFVDDPGDSVKQADQLVEDVIQNITKSFADRRGSLERQWNGGEKASTEDLRLALKQYRSFFDRLLTLES